jgi:hypothetical protein
MTSDEQDAVTLAEPLKRAAAAVSAAELPEGLQAAAFSVVAQHLVGGPPAPAAALSREAEHPPADLQGSFELLARRLGVEAAALGRVFELDDEGVHLLIPRQALPETKQQAMVEVAYLIIASRQALGLDEYTTVDTVKQAAEDRGCYDSGNFWKAMGVLDGNGVRIRGTGKNRTFKINQVGFERAAAIIRRIAAPA